MDGEAVSAYDEALVRDDLCWEAYLGRGKPCWECSLFKTIGEVPMIWVEGPPVISRGAFVSWQRAWSGVSVVATALLVIGDYARCENLVESWFRQGHEQEFDARSDLFYVLGFARLFSGHAEKGIVAFLEMEKLGRSIEDSLFVERFVSRYEEDGSSP